MREPPSSKASKGLGRRDIGRLVFACFPRLDGMIFHPRSSSLHTPPRGQAAPSGGPATYPIGREADGSREGADQARPRLIAQRLDRVEQRRLPRRVEPEAAANQAGGEDGVD